MSSRAKEFEEYKAKIEEAKEGIEDLSSQLSEWHDNMPENLKEGQKAEELQEAVDNLDQIVSSLDDALEVDVEFPGMMG